MLDGVDIGLLLAAWAACSASACSPMARGPCSAASGNEVIERLERATSGGMDLGHDARAPEKSFARIASILAPFAKLVKPTGGEDLSRLNRSLIHAGYRTENAVEIFLGVKLLLPPLAIIGLWQINIHLAAPMEFPADSPRR